MMKPEQVSLRSVITTSSLEQQQQQQQQLDVDAIAEVNLSWRCRELMARLASSIDSTSLLLVDNINDQSSAAGPSSGLITRARSLGHCRR
jgi:sulfate adenylyltransferase subunit 1 (EFTu-like GTPase family)